MKLRRVGLKIAGAIGALIIGSVFVYFIVSRPVKLPEEFFDARSQAANISQRIVDLTSLTNDKVKAINLSDLNDNVHEAISLIREARESNAEAYDKASELSRHLQKLAESLADIRKRESQRLAYESVAVELSLVSEFIVYTQTLNRFFDNLSQAIATDSFADRRSVEERLNEVNEQAQKINNLNKEFLLKIGDFDKSL